MAQSQDLRVQFVVPAAPTSASGVKLYINPTSGVNIIGSDGIQRWIGGQTTGQLPLSVIRTGGAATLSTGIIFTAFTGAGSANQTGIGMPLGFLPYLISDGTIVGIPYFPIKTPGT